MCASNLLFDRPEPQSAPLPQEYPLKPLSVASTLGETFRRIFSNWKPLLRAVLLPALTDALATVGRSAPFASQGIVAIWVQAIVPTAISGIAGVLIAVSSHRVVLLGAGALENSWGMHWSRREFAFLIRAAVLGLIAGLGWTLIPILIGIGQLEAERVRWVGKGWWILSAYPISRLSLVLPAVAIDRSFTFADSWRLSRGNGWRLTCVLFVGPLLLIVAGSAWSAGNYPWAVAVRALVFSLLGVFEIVALSVSYQHLVAGEPSQVAGGDPAHRR